jgi:hypothetical protein
MAKLLLPGMAYRTRPIVRLEGDKRMVTKGYRKGVYERVTKGIRAESVGGAGFVEPAASQEKE